MGQIVDRRPASVAAVKKLQVVSSPSTAATQEALAGLVERVTFHNAENGFSVLRAKAEQLLLAECSERLSAFILREYETCKDRGEARCRILRAICDLEDELLELRNERIEHNGCCQFRLQSDHQEVYLEIAGKIWNSVIHAGTIKRVPGEPMVFRLAATPAAASGK